MQPVWKAEQAVLVFKEVGASEHVFTAHDPTVVPVPLQFPSVPMKLVQVVVVP